MCQNCKSEFVIEPEDFDFYTKMQVPPPTFCPDCRLQRRLAQRMERTLHRRKCGAPGHSEEIISVYPPDKQLCVYDKDFWWSDEWDPLDYGREYDFSKPFFQQFRELLETVPLAALFDSKSTNSYYCNMTLEHKNCYLVSAGWSNEDSMYSNRVSNCKNTLDSSVCYKIEFGYENVNCRASNRLFFSRNSEGCANSYFLYDCVNCSDCIACTGLRNKNYHIFNQRYSKEDYKQKVAELDLASRKGLNQVREKFETLCLRAIHRYANIYRCENVIGDNVEDSKNCYYCFDLAGNAENVKYSNWGTYGAKDSYDAGPGCGGKSEMIYEGMGTGTGDANCAFFTVVYGSNSVRYAFNCHGSQNLFGCVSVRGKQYCILNKQYSKEEYEVLVPKIIEHMKTMPYSDKKGRTYGYGEFFPAEISPFAYNDTMAQEYFPLTKERAEAEGYPWRVSEDRVYQATKQAGDLPDSIALTPDTIMNEVVACAHDGACAHACTTAFKIVTGELQFYRQFNLPVPQLCPNCRHHARLAQRNPMKLWERSCQCAGMESTAQATTNYSYKNGTAHFHGTGQCPNKFQTPYAPERPEIVYCEQCYQAEVV
jgi:hypothetical protein